MAQFNELDGLAVTPWGDLVVADSGNHRIRLIQRGNVSTLAGDGTKWRRDGSPETARFDTPVSVAVDKKGVIYVGEYSKFSRKSARVRVATAVP